MNVPANGVVAPITALSIVPPFISALAITTCPVPAGAITRSEFEFVVLISLSVMLMFESMVRFCITTLPVPPGVKFISAFELELIVLSCKVRLSMLVVVKLVVLVTLRVERVANPDGTCKVEERFTAPVKVLAPDTSNVPSTTRPSLMLIIVESSELNVVPLNLIAPKTTEPVPFGTKFMFSFDLVPSMLLSLILIAGKDTAPVPEGLNTKSSLDLVADISLPLKLRSPPVSGDRYNSVNIVFTFCMADLRVSPVPSFAFDPVFSVCCAILNLYYSFDQFDHLVVSVIYCS